MGLVYQAIDTERNMKVAVKTLINMDTDNLVYLKREFRALHDIAHPNLCSFMELIQDEDSWILTMELIKGVDFQTYVQGAMSAKTTVSAILKDKVQAGIQQNECSHSAKGQAMDSLPLPVFNERRLRKSLAGLCEGLNALHEMGKVHRDIKPSNVLIDKDDRVVLLDFGLITEREIQRQTDLGTIVGTAAYMAPEQAQSQSLGPAADWYSVGVMLYEVLTGRLPFEGPAAKILLDKQIFSPKRPRDVSPGLPDDLETLCYELLSREPGNRPPVDKILNMTRHGQTITSIALSNAFTAFTVSELFVGRATELQVLNDAYRDMGQTTFSTVVIEGVSGVGKSALVKKFTTDVLAADTTAVVLRGRCYEYESSPFKAFDGVIESLITQLKRLPTDELFDLDPDQAALLVRLFPSLRKLNLFTNISWEKSEIEDPNELQKQSFGAVASLLRQLGELHPLIVVIDDMQWADADSLALLKTLGNDPMGHSVPLLLVLLSRIADQEESAPANLNKYIQATHRKIRLKPLTESESTRLAQMLIARETMPINVSADLIAKEADGHPLYIAELVHHIAAVDGTDWKSLRLDDVIWNRVNVLPQTARRILKIVCVAGTPMAREHVQILAKVKSDDFHKSISFLRASKLIRSRGPRKNHLVEPYHDRVRETVAAQVREMGKAQKTHLRIGRFLMHSYSETEIDKNVFTIVQHLHAGRDLIENPKEKIRLADLYFLAGKKSRNSAAFASSLAFLKESIDCLPDDSFETHYSKVFDLYCYTAEVAYIAGDSALAEKIAKEATVRARSSLDKARVYETYLLSLVANGKPVEAIDECVEMIRQLGIKVPRRPGKLYILWRMLRTKNMLRRKTTEQLFLQPKINNPNIVAARSLMAATSATAYFYARNIWAMLVLKGVAWAIKYGVDRYSALTFIGWTSINNYFFKDYAEGYRYGQLSLNLLDHFKDSSKKAMTLLVYTSFCQHWVEHIRNTLPKLDECYDIANKTCDLPYMAFSRSAYVRNLFLAGAPLSEVIDQSANYTRTCENKNQILSNNTNRIYSQAAENLMDKSEQLAVLVGSYYNEHEMIPRHIERDDKRNLFDAYFCKIYLNLFFGRYYEAYQAFKESEKYKPASVVLTPVSFSYAYISLALLKFYPSAGVFTQLRLLRQVRRNQKICKSISKISPENHAHKYHFVEAERARLKRRIGKAQSLYETAIQGAEKNGFTQDAALASEFAAEFFKEIGEEEKAVQYANRSIIYYEKWGAPTKMIQLRKQIGF